VASRLTVFVSSTVRDFGPVRRDLKHWLKSRRIDVRESEDPEFPVDPAVHSHDACLRAIEGCHLFVLLVGWRYGGLYYGSQQSITWREYDEAVARRIPVVALVLKEVADEATRVAQERRGGATPSTRLEPAIVRFLDALRKGHIDNWVHLDWDGSCIHARRTIEARMNTLFVNYLRPHQELQALAERFPTYAKDRWFVEATAARIRHEIAATHPSPAERRRHLEGLLGVVAELRHSLFGFDDERYDFVVHKRTGNVLRVFARAHHPAILPRNRAWQLGQGYVGRAAEDPEKIIIGDNLQQWSDWKSEYDSDELNYRSAVCVPMTTLAAPLGPAAAVLTVTSSRLGHFQLAEDLEPLTARSLATIIQLTGVLDDEPDQATAR
jgi:hypothetical protein